MAAEDGELADGRYPLGVLSHMHLREAPIMPSLRPSIYLVPDEGAREAEEPAKPPPGAAAAAFLPPPFY